MFASTRRACTALFAVALAATATADDDSAIVFIPVYEPAPQSLAADNTCWADAPAGAEILCVSGPEHLALHATLSLSSATSSQVTVRLRSSDISARAGDDYRAINRQITFAPNTTEAQVDISLINDLTVEMRETFTIELHDKSDEQLLSLDYIHVTILDEDGITMTVRNARANESKGEILHFIDLSEGVTWPIRFGAKTLDGTATAPEDYSPRDVSGTHVPDLEPGKLLTGVFRMHPIVDDAIDEPDETYTLRITGLRGVARTTDEGTMTIVDNDPTSTNILLTAQPPRVSEDDGATEVRVTATLDASARTHDTPVTVSVAASGNAGVVDFVEVDDFTLTIAAGDTNGTGTFTLTPVDDDLDEADEKITIDGSADLAVTADTIELVDDDEGSAAVILSASPDRISEGGGARTIDVTAALDGGARAVDTTVRVSVTDSGQRQAVDYTATRTDFEIVISSGVTAATATFTVTPADDDVDERDEVLDVDGTSDLPVTPTSVTLTDDDPTSTEIVLSAAPSTVAEDAGTTAVEVTATLDAGARAQDTRVRVSVSGSGDPDAVDFTSVPDFVISIAAGTTSGRGSFNLTPHDDDVEEVGETLTVSGSAVLPVSAASVAITDNDVASDGIALSASPAVVSEGAGTVSVRVTASLNGAARQAQTVVTVSVSGGGDPQAVDFRPVADFTITVATGEVSGTGTFTLEPLDDATVEIDETLTLSGESDLPVESTSVRLADDDDPSTRIVLSADPDRVSEGDGPTPVTVTATLDRARRQQATSIAVSVSGSGEADAADFAAVSDFAITIPANAASGTATFTLEAEDDTTVETDEQVTIAGMSDLPVTSTTVTLADDDEASTRILLFLAVDPPRASEGDGEVRVTVTAALDKGGRPEETRITVSVAGSGDPDAVDFAPVPDFEIVIPENAPDGTATFTVVPEDDLIDEKDELVTVSGESDLPVTPATMELLDDDEPPERVLLAVDPGRVSESEGPTVVTVTASLDPGVRQEATTVTVSVGGSGDPHTVGFAAVPDFPITIEANAASATGTFVLSPEDDDVDEADETLTLTGGSDLPVSPTSMVLADDDEPPALTVADAAGDEDVGVLEFAVTLSAASGVEVSAAYATTDGSATAGNDYTAAAGTIVFAPGEVAQSIRVAILDDAVHEPDEETFELSLSALVNATAAQASATGTIRDDDQVPPSVSGQLPPALLCVGGAVYDVDLAVYFGGDELQYSAASSAPEIAAAAVSGSRLTVVPVAEGEASVTLTAANDAGTVESVLGVRVVTDPAELDAVDSVLASIGRGVLTSVTGSVQARFADARASGGQGSTRPTTLDGTQAVPGTRTLANPWLGPTHRSRAVDWNRLFQSRDDHLDTSGQTHRRSMAPFSFSLQSGQSGSTRPSWSVWGRHDQQRFESGSGGSSHDGALSAVHLGADVQLGDWLAGVSLARSRAEADYRFARSVAACGGTGLGEGMVDADLTSVHPYVGRRVGNGWVWATIGGGDGDVSAERCVTGLRREAELSMRMAAVGGRHPFGGGERIAVSIVEEVGMLAVTTGDVPGPLGDRSVTVGQARLGLEAAGVVQPGCECSLSSFVRVFARGDWGDGTTGAGLELAAGVRYRNLPWRLGVDAGVRALAVHAQEDVEDRSAEVTISILPAEDGTGLQASLAWRQESRDLWRQPLGGPSPWTLRAEGIEHRERRWVAASRIGYGLATGRGATDARAVTVPFLEIGGGNSSRGIGRLGVRHAFGGLVVEWGVGRSDATWGGGRQFVLAANGTF